MTTIKKSLIIIFYYKVNGMVNIKLVILYYILNHICSLYYYQKILTQLIDNGVL